MTSHSRAASFGLFLFYFVAMGVVYCDKYEQFFWQVYKCLASKAFGANSCKSNP
jgi:hypothetical protein